MAGASSDAQSFADFIQVAANGAAAFHSEDLPGNLGGFSPADLENGLFNMRNRGGGHAEIIYSHADEEYGTHRVCRHFSADRNLFSHPVRHVRHPFYGMEHSWMK